MLSDNSFDIKYGLKYNIANYILFCTLFSKIFELNLANFTT